MMKVQAKIMSSLLEPNVRNGHFLLLALPREMLPCCIAVLELVGLLSA